MQRNIFARQHWILENFLKHFRFPAKRDKKRSHKQSDSVGKRWTNPKYLTYLFNYKHFHIECNKIINWLQTKYIKTTYQLIVIKFTFRIVGSQVNINFVHKFLTRTHTYPISQFVVAKMGPFRAKHLFNPKKKKIISIFIKRTHFIKPLCNAKGLTVHLE